jgi:hypothetical protein
VAKYTFGKVFGKYGGKLAFFTIYGTLRFFFTIPTPFFACNFLSKLQFTNWLPPSLGAPSLELHKKVQVS